MKHRIVAAAILVLFSSTASFGQDVAEILSKHRASIGTPEAIATVKNRMATGTSEFQTKTPVSRLAGKALIASDGRDKIFLSSFNSPDYPFEKAALADGKVSIAFIAPGMRSPLGTVIRTNPNLLSEGLLGGSLTQGWILVVRTDVSEKLRYGGKAKVRGREAYVLQYMSGSSSTSDSSIKFFFDAATGRHLKSEYRWLIPNRNYQIGILGQSFSSGGSYKMEEEFDDFEKHEGLTLPRSYSIKLMLDSSVGTAEFVWSIKIDQVKFNQNLRPDFFKIDESEVR